MSKTNLESFVNQFVALVSGDNDKVAAEKAFRQRTSALKSHISSYEGDTIDLEDAVESAQDKLDKARLGNGKAITDRKVYIQDLFSKKNKLEEAKEKLEAHKEKIAFLKAELG